MSLCRLDRIPIVNRCGFYFRWYYNGWHYWLFYEGRLGYVTEGEKYRTYGLRRLTVNSGQLTLEQVSAVRSVLNATDVYLYTDFGWAQVRIETGSASVKNNYIDGYELVMTAIIGSRMVSASGLSPAAIIPIVTPEPIPQCEQNIAIASQIWMCRNYDLAYPASRVYDNDEANRLEYGGLYKYSQVVAAGFCPADFHVPSLAEWQALIAAVEAASPFADAGGVLKEAGTTHWDSPNTDAIDLYDFAMRSTGYYTGVGGFVNLGIEAVLWATDGVVRFRYDTGVVTALPFALIIPSTYYGVRLIKNTYVANTPVAIAASNRGSGAFVANWNAAVGATGYFLDVSTDPLFGSFVTGYNNLSVGNVTTYEVAGLSPSVTYYYRLRGTNGSEVSTNSNTISTSTYSALVVTTRGAGTSTAMLKVLVSTGCTLSLDGTAKFYSNSAGTLGESSTWTPAAGSLQTRYVKCPSGTANLMINDVTKLLQWGDVQSHTTGTIGWQYSGGTPADTPKITLDNWYYPNCIHIYVSFPELTTFNFALSALSANFFRGIFSGTGTVTGSLSDLRATNTKLTITQTNVISGNITDIPAAMYEFHITGSNVITGDIGDLDSNFLWFQVEGNNTVSGNLADLPPTRFMGMTVTGANTITGNIADLPATVHAIYLAGNNTITGDLADFPAIMDQVTVEGSNTLSGDLADMPAGMTYFIVLGNNTITGGFTGLPASLTILILYGNNTVNGVLNDLIPNIGNIQIFGANTVSGDLADLPSSMYVFVVGGNNAINTYTSRVWSGTGFTLQLTSSGASGLSVAEITQLVIDFTGLSFTASTLKTLALTGTNANMADVTDGGIWGTFVGSPDAPSTLATSAKHLVRTHGVTLTLVGITWPALTGDGTGLPAGFGNWWRS